MNENSKAKSKIMAKVNMIFRQIKVGASVIPLKSENNDMKYEAVRLS